MSAITPEAKEAVAQFERIEFARTATGTAWLGTTLADWPAGDVELSIALASETNRLTNSKLRSESVHTSTPSDEPIEPEE